MAVKPKQKKKVPSKVAETDQKEVTADSSASLEVLQKPVANESSSQVDNNNHLAENGAATNKNDGNNASSGENSENTLSSCQLDKQQVIKAVNAAFRAFKASKEKNSSENLFEDTPETVSLLVSSIKVTDARPKPILANLPNPVYTKESDICLIVKDLEKGWKVDHEPTIQHYKELLGSCDVNYITEVMPLRQLRVEFKPFEARGKLAKRFDIMLVDKEVANFVPRYLGKAFYQNGKLPIPVDLKSKNLAKELEKALGTSTMSMTNNGTSSTIRVGLSNFEEEQLVDNIMAVYETLSKKFPGKFANVRNLTLRFGREDWTVPIYISYASRESVVLPPTPKDTAPIIDDLTTLAPGQKVAVYKSGKVVVVKDENYQRTPLDDVEDDEVKRKKPRKSAKKQKKQSDDEDDILSESGGEEDMSDVNDNEEESEAEDEEKKGPEQKTAPKKADGDDDSSDDGDALEDEYMEELALMEEEVDTKSKNETNTKEEPPSKKPKPAKKVVKVKTAKKQKVK